MRHFLTFILFWMAALQAVSAQQLALNIQAPPDITLTVLTDGNLDYGTVFPNEGTVQITLNDTRTEELQIEGQQNQRVRVTITPPPSLRLDASNELPYTLGAAYANEGENNKSQATSFGGSNSVVFRLPKAGGGPGRGGGGGQPTTSAYLYVFGDISVGFVAAGQYSGTLNILVEYE